MDFLWILELTSTISDLDSMDQKKIKLEKAFFDFFKFEPTKAKLLFDFWHHGPYNFFENF